MDNQSGTKTGTRPHQYKCGVCSEEGHNSRNCPLRTGPYRGAPKTTISPTKNGIPETMVQATQPQQPPIVRRPPDVMLDNGLGREWTTENTMRHANAVTDMYGQSNPNQLNGPLFHAVSSARRRVLQCAEHVSSCAAGPASGEDYSSAVADLVSAMDSLERVVKCAMRFTAVNEERFDANDPDKKRRRGD